MPASRPAPTLVLFDGRCGLCCRTVQFVLRRDRHARFRFSPLETPAAARACASAGVPLADPAHPESIVVIADGRAFERSDAALAIASRLPLPWPLLGILWIIPRALRDRLYRVVARNRVRWFGRRDACMVPTPDLRERFLE